MPPETGDSLASDPVGHTKITTSEPSGGSARHGCLRVSPAHPGVPVTAVTQKPQLLHGGDWNFGDAFL